MQIYGIYCLKNWRIGFLRYYIISTTEYFVYSRSCKRVWEGKNKYVTWGITIYQESADFSM